MVCTNIKGKIFLCLAVNLVASFANCSFSQDYSRHADLPAGEIPDPYQLYQRLAKSHSLPSIAQNSAEKYKELLQSVDPEFLNSLSSQQKHSLRKMANEMLANSESPQQLEQLGNQFENMRSQFAPPDGSSNDSSNSNSLNQNGIKNLVDKLKNRFNGSNNEPGDNDTPFLPQPNQGGSGGNARSRGGGDNSTRSGSPVANDNEPTPKTRMEFNRKMNRLLFNAAKSSLEKQQGASSDAEGSDGEGSGGGSAWQSLVNRLAESAKKHIDDPSLKTRYGGKFKSVFSKIRNATSSRSFYNRFRSNSDSLSRLSPSSAGTWILFGAMIAIGFGVGFVYLKNRDREDGSTANLPKKPMTITVPKFTTNAQLVNTVDETICWISESDARWWNARLAERYLFKKCPAEKTKIRRLVGYYEKARYQAPLTPLSAEEFFEANMIVKQLVMVHSDQLKKAAEITS